MKKIVKFTLFMVIMLLSLTSCASNKDEKTNAKTYDKNLTIGTSPLTTDIVKAAVPSIEKLGYKVKIKNFDDFVLPNTALKEGSIDLNIYQHEPYLDSYNKNNGTDLVFANRIGVGLLGIYSEKYETLESIPQGARFGIHQDASNQDRALRMLESKNIITLNKKEGLYNLLDIKENPKKIEFITMDIAQLVRGLDDLDVSFVNNLNLVLSKVEPKYTIMIENTDELAKKYAIGLVVRKENKDEKWINDILEAFKTKETRDRLEKMFSGAFKTVLDN